MTEWEPVIGLEVHVQLGTNTKAFSPSAGHYGAPPNSLTDPTVLGLPGALPTFNEQALMFAIKLGLATGCSIRNESRFARKHYFYPDLPKGYQISQYDEPLCENGTIEFWLGDEKKTVRLERIHIEEDAGKNTHQLGATSLVDLNRAGVPLCEVVSRPDIRSAEEAAEYMRALRRIVRYVEVSEGNMEQGHLRCDANVSIRPKGETELRTRVELKNINSFRFVQKAIEHEIRRQKRIYEEGGTIKQETRLWDANAGVSQAMRSKEEANDYRYFPDPDLPPLVVENKVIEEIRGTLPELPMERCVRLAQEVGLPLDDAKTLSDERELGDYYDAALNAHGGDGNSAKLISNWILSELMGELNKSEETLSSCKVKPTHIADLVKLIEDETISGKLAKDVFAKMFTSGDDPNTIVERDGMKQITDDSAIEKICRDVIAANPGQTEQYKAGKEALLGYFVGQVMKASKGKANPQLAGDMLRKILGT